MAVKTTLHDEIGDFTTIPNDFLNDRKQSPLSRLLFIYLRFHTHGKRKRAFPGYERLIIETGLTRQKVAAGIKTLEATGWLVKHKRFASTTEYELHNPTRLSSIVERREEPPLVPQSNSLSSTVEQPPLSVSEQDLKTKIEGEGAGAPASNKKQKSKPYPSKSDWPRHIAIYFSITNFAPMQQLWPLIEQRMGLEPDVAKLRECYVAWIGRGFNPRAVTWLDWFRDGIPSRPNASGGQHKEPKPRGAQLRRPINWKELGIAIGDPMYLWNGDE